MHLVTDLTRDITETVNFTSTKQLHANNLITFKLQKGKGECGCGCHNHHLICNPIVNACSRLASLSACAQSGNITESKDELWFYVLVQ
jgi:hypothetical protein